MSIIYSLKYGIQTIITTVILLLVVNFLFVYFSPSIVPSMPIDIVRGISPCYRTLFNTDVSDHSKDTTYEIIYGDSFTEGAGDEFLANKPNYGFLKKLNTEVEPKFLIFGRGGYGSRGTRVEENRCFPLLTRFTTFSPTITNINSATFVFYEGNDLNDNIKERGRLWSKTKYQLSFFLPLFRYIQYKFQNLDISKPNSSKPHDRSTDLASSTSITRYPITDSGIQLNAYPQAAAVELTEQEYLDSLQILKESLAMISKKYGHKRLQFLYLPSVASSYHFTGPLPVRSYKGNIFYLTDGATNRQSSSRIRQTIRKISTELGWEFCDTTDALIDKSSSGIALHGPQDWSHFNETGYQVVKSVYLNCFS